MGPKRKAPGPPKTVRPPAKKTRGAPSSSTKNTAAKPQAKTDDSERKVIPESVEEWMKFARSAPGGYPPVSPAAPSPRPPPPSAPDPKKRRQDQNALSPDVAATSIKGSAVRSVKRVGTQENKSPPSPSPSILSVGFFTTPERAQASNAGAGPVSLSPQPARSCPLPRVMLPPASHQPATSQPPASSPLPSSRLSASRRPPACPPLPFPAHWACCVAWHQPGRAPGPDQQEAIGPALHVFGRGGASSTGEAAKTRAQTRIAMASPTRESAVRGVRNAAAAICRQMGGRWRGGRGGRGGGRGGRGGGMGAKKFNIRYIRTVINY
ncbi:hypothetical protein N8T08_008153 [Aspergillus melleus]|uniref:Uncharacterized protein n=1 Tax=Aspergillus melleus TaxID=138277 RepID=A0ACC3AW01_9EURO|nr:hypothetical protein N8T08_008153 [Aspergillus melleus]